MHSSKRKSLDFESESYKEGMKMLMMKKITVDDEDGEVDKEGGG